MLTTGFSFVPSRALLLYISSVYHVMHKYLSERGEVQFDKIFDQRIGKWFGAKT